MSLPDVPHLTAAERGLFKSYDIRGPSPVPLSAALAGRIGEAFAHWLGGGVVGVGRDMRKTSPALAREFAAGLRRGGASVADCGMLATDAMWFAVQERQLDGGAMVTASHNPPTDNGIKLVARNAAPVFQGNGLPRIQELVDAPELPAGAKPAAGAVQRLDIADAYLRFLEEQIRIRPFPSLRVVLDAGNGMGGLMAERLFARLPGAWIPMHFRPDGAFPNHGGNPLQPENRAELAARVRAERADFGVLWDGDADRCAFVDDRGAFVPGDFATALLAPAEIARAPGGAVVFDLRSSRAVPEAILEAGGRPCPNRVGHAWMKQRMRKEDACFGGELSGHFYFPATGHADNALLPVLRMGERIAAAGRPLSELADALRRRHFTLDEISIRVPSPAAALLRICAAFPDAKPDRTDGVTLDFPDWRFTLRPSNTEPVLRLTLEAFRPGLAEACRDRILELLRESADADGYNPAPVVRV